MFVECLDGDGVECKGCRLTDWDMTGDVFFVLVVSDWMGEFFIRVVPDGQGMWFGT